MKLQQLRYLREVVRKQLNITEAANSIFTSQPGVSRQLHLLERELGIELFVRNSRRIVSLTPNGQAIVKIAERVLGDIENMKRVGEEALNETHGSLAVATTPTLARYTFSPALCRFVHRHPQVQFSLKLGDGNVIADLVASGTVDLGLGTENVGNAPDLVSVPIRQYERVIIVPEGHPLLSGRITLQKIARFPLVTYDEPFAARQQLMQVFAAAGIAPRVVLGLPDADMIKACVGEGAGIAVLSEVVFRAGEDRGLRAIRTHRIFPPTTTYLAVRRHAFLRRYAYDFLHDYSDNLSRSAIEAALA